MHEALFQLVGIIRVDALLECQDRGHNYHREKKPLQKQAERVTMPYHYTFLLVLYHNQPISHYKLISSLTKMSLMKMTIMIGIRTSG